MSVINQMLTELDARQARLPADWALAALGAPVTPPPRAARRPWLLLLAGSALIAAAAWTDWPRYLPGDAEAADPAPTARPDHAGGDEPPAALTMLAAPRRGMHYPAPVRIGPANPGPPGPPDLDAAATQAAALAIPALLMESPPAAGPRPAPAAGPAIEAMPPATATATATAVPSPPPAPAGPALAMVTPAAGPVAIEKRLVAMTPAQRAALAYRQAVELAAAGHGTQAIDKALDALKAEPDHVPARQLAAVLMFEKQRLNEAVDLLREGLDRQPRQPQLVVLTARLKAEAGDAPAALATLAQTDEPGAEGHGLRAVILSRQGRYGEAAPAYEAALRLAPDNAAWWVGLGVALDAEGQPAAARRALQRARALGSLSGDLLAFVDQKLASLN